MKKRLVWLTVCLLATTAAARDLEDILKEKGVIDAVEANEAKAAKEKQQATTEKAVSSIPALPEWVKMVTLFGDVRLRNESFFQSGTADRIRQRFRLRFGAKIKPNDELESGFKLASGNANDPISNNQTFTDEFTFKNINIANAYIKLTPYKSIGLERPWVTLMGGKFDQPMYVPPSPNMLVFDKDLTPEGLLREPEARRREGRVPADSGIEPRAMDLPGEQQHRRGGDLRLPGPRNRGSGRCALDRRRGRLPL